MKTQVLAAALLLVVIVGLAGAEAEADAEAHPGYDGKYYFGYRDARLPNVFGDYGFYDRDRREAQAEPAENAETENGAEGESPREHQVFKRAAEAEASGEYYGWGYPYRYLGGRYYRPYWK